MVVAAKDVQDRALEMIEKRARRATSNHADRQLERKSTTQKAKAPTPSLHADDISDPRHHSINP